MADNPPYVMSTGLIPKILEKVKQAPPPDRFTQDFLGTKLGFSSGSARPIIPFLKRIGFLASDGTPTELYKSFRNPDKSAAAIAKGMRHGYAELYSRNEYVHEMDDKKLEGFMIEVTGLEKGSSTLAGILGSFKALKVMADFSQADIGSNGSAPLPPEDVPPPLPKLEVQRQEGPLNIAYTFNLNLPETANIAVFNAIFKALRENMLIK